MGRIIYMVFHHLCIVKTIYVCAYICIAYFWEDKQETRETDKKLKAGEEN